MIHTLSNDRYQHTIPESLGNASFALSLFAPALSKKIRNRARYYSPFSKAQTQKSSRAKSGISKGLGYMRFQELQPGIFGLNLASIKRQAGG